MMENEDKIEVSSSEGQVHELFNVADSGAKNMPGVNPERFAVTPEDEDEEDNGYFGKKFLNSVYTTGKDFGQDFYETFQQAPGLPMSMITGVVARKRLSESQKDRTAYINQITGGKYKEGVNTIDDYIEKDYRLQNALGFADNKDEYKKAIENYLSPLPSGNARDFKIVEDDRENKPWYMPKYYISVEKDDGSYTDYSNPNQTVSDFVARAAGQVGFEVVAGSAQMGAAASLGTASAGLTAMIPFVGPFLAPFVGGAVFLSTLYTGGVAAERAREEYIKNVLNLDEEEKKTFEDFVSMMGDLVKKHPPTAFVTDVGRLVAAPFSENIDLGDVKMLNDEELFTTQAKTPQEEMSGWMTTFAGPFGRVIDKIRTAKDRFSIPQELEDFDVNKLKPDGGGIRGVNVEGGLNIPIYRQMLDATNDAKMLKPGGRFAYLNVDFHNFVLSTYTPSKLIERLSALAQQTSLVLPNILKKQNNQLRTIIERYNTGQPVVFEDFQKPLQAMRGAFEKLSKEKRGDFDTMARDLGGLDGVFGSLRLLESKIQYRGILDKIGPSSYNLKPLKDKLQGIIDEDTMIQPTTNKETGKITYQVAPSGQAQENFHLKRIIAELQSLGGKDGTLNIDQSRQAKNSFVEEMVKAKLLPQGFKSKNLDTPAELIHTYAVTLGRLAYDKFKNTNGMEAEFAMAKDLRNTLLDLLKSPEPRKANKAAFPNFDGLDENGIKEIGPMLDSANKFYKDTLETRSMDDRVQTLLEELREKLRANEEPGEVLNQLVGTYQQPPPRGKVTTLTKLGEMTKYIQEQGDDILKRARELDIDDGIFHPTKGVTEAFANLKNDFHATLYEMLTQQTKLKFTDPDRPTALVEFLNKMDNKQKQVLGITKAKEEELRQLSETTAKLFDKEFVDLIRSTRAKSPTYSLVDNVFEAKDFDTELDRLVQTGADKSKIRDGIFQYMFDMTHDKSIFKIQDRNTPYFDANQFYVDASTLQKYLMKLRNSDIIKDNKILSDDDVAFLDMTENLAVALRGANKADAGVALAGAQIYGELFTVKLAKFFGGVARLAAQRRISKIISNEGLVNYVTGATSNRKPVGFTRRAFLGYGAAIEALTNLAIINPQRDGSDANENSIEQEIEREPTIFGLEDRIEQSSLNQQTDKLFASAVP